MKRTTIKEMIETCQPGTRYIEDNGITEPSGIRIVTGVKIDEDQPEASVLMYSELRLGATVFAERGESSQYDSTPCYIMEPEDLVKLGPFMSAVTYRYGERDDVANIPLNLPKIDISGAVEYFSKGMNDG